MFQKVGKQTQPLWPWVVHQKYELVVVSNPKNVLPKSENKSSKAGYYRTLARMSTLISSCMQTTLCWLARLPHRCRLCWTPLQLWGGDSAWSCTTQSSSCWRAGAVWHKISQQKSDWVIGINGLFGQHSLCWLWPPQWTRQEAWKSLGRLQQTC